MKHCISVAHCPFPGGGGGTKGSSPSSPLSKTSVAVLPTAVPDAPFFFLAAPDPAVAALFVSKMSKPEIAKKYMTMIVNMKTVVSRRMFMRTEDSTIARSGLWITPKR